MHYTRCSPLAEPPIGLFGGNAQTLWAALAARRCVGNPCRLVRERWTTPDGDFIDVDWLAEPPGASSAAPLLVLFHGLEGSSSSHYAQAFAYAAAARGWRFAVPHFRGCSGAVNLNPRAYHSGDHQEIDWVLRRFSRVGGGSPLLAVGVSLGGNALMRWAAEWGAAATQVVKAVAAVSAPLNLAVAGHAIDTGLNRWLYARMFLRTMRAKAQAKWQQYPGLFDLSAAIQARTLYAFDDAFTAPLHGFDGVDDYWRRAAAGPVLADVVVPSLLLNAGNDPFVPASSLPDSKSCSRSVTLWQPEQGGHVGFVAPTGRWGWPGQVYAMPQAVTDWLAEIAGV